MKKFRGPGFAGVAGVIAGDIKKGTVKKAVSAGADLLEVRIDTFKNRGLEGLRGSIETLKSTELPIILTVRSHREGGADKIPDKKRVEIFDSLTPFADMVDIELSSGNIVKTVVNFARRDGKKVIISYHNFKTTPAVKKLQDIIKKSRAMGADIVKIATFASGVEDLKKLAEILCDSNDLIVIAMGPDGAASRVFFPFLGSLVTYGSITEKTAPGQLSLKFLKKELKVYGL